MPLKREDWEELLRLSSITTRNPQEQQNQVVETSQEHHTSDEKTQNRPSSRSSKQHLTSPQFNKTEQLSIGLRQSLLKEIRQSPMKIKPKVSLQVVEEEIIIPSLQHEINQSRYTTTNEWRMKADKFSDKTDFVETQEVRQSHDDDAKISSKAVKSHNYKKSQVVEIDPDKATASGCSLNELVIRIKLTPRKPKSLDPQMINFHKHPNQPSLEKELNPNWSKHQRHKEDQDTQSQIENLNDSDLSSDED